jgi:hypothetical protein
VAGCEDLQNDGLGVGLDLRDISLGLRFVVLDIEFTSTVLIMSAAFQAPSICSYGSSQDDGHGPEALR